MSVLTELFTSDAAGVPACRADEALPQQLHGAYDHHGGEGVSGQPLADQLSARPAGTS